MLQTQHWWEPGHYNPVWNSKHSYDDSFQEWREEGYSYWGCAGKHSSYMHWEILVNWTGSLLYVLYYCWCVLDWLLVCLWSVDWFFFFLWYSLKCFEFVLWLVFLYKHLSIFTYFYIFFPKYFSIVLDFMLQQDGLYYSPHLSPKKKWKICLIF